MRKILEKTFVIDVEHHASIGSTNDRAIQCAAPERVKLPLLIITDCQTAGRGRGSNRWWTGPGSLAFSLLIGPEPPSTVGMPATGGCVGWASQPVQKESPSTVGMPATGGRRSGLVALAAGVAVVEALAPWVPGHEIGIHWPNDVMLDGRKLAGILIEVLSDGKLVIGIGINTNNTATDAPEEVRPRVVTLRDVTGRSHDHVELLISILCQLQRQLAALSVSPESVAARTHELCLQRGKRLQIVQGEKPIEGRCLGIATDGAMLLEIDGKPQMVYSGVVTLVEG
ncbi:MAG: biotin--[acetyl-CoA-carboxylase] ligase [Planctomycetota bacterium]